MTSEKANHKPTDINLLYNQPIMEEAFDNGLAELIKTSCPPIDRHHKLSASDFQAQYVQKERPVILTGLNESWQQRDIFNLAYFQNKAGHIEVLIDQYNHQSTKRGTIKSLIDEIESNSNRFPVYLQEWWFEKDFPEFFEDFTICPHFEDDWGRKILGYSSHTLWIGAKNALTPIHCDPWAFNIATTQLTGKKEWYLFSKDAFLPALEDGTPDFETFLLDPKTKPRSGIVQTGDVLFMPRKWWHRTMTLEHSASFNTPYLTEKSIQTYVRAILSSLTNDTLMLHEELKRERARNGNTENKGRLTFDHDIERLTVLAHFFGNSSSESH